MHHDTQGEAYFNGFQGTVSKYMYMTESGAEDKMSRPISP